MNNLPMRSHPLRLLAGISAWRRFRELVRVGDFGCSVGVTAGVLSGAAGALCRNRQGKISSQIILIKT